MTDFVFNSNTVMTLQFIIAFFRQNKLCFAHASLVVEKGQWIISQEVHLRSWAGGGGGGGTSSRQCHISAMTLVRIASLPALWIYCNAPPRNDSPAWYPFQILVANGHIRLADKMFQFCTALCIPTAWYGSWASGLSYPCMRSPSPGP
jgi:hypothetical protein